MITKQQTLEFIYELSQKYEVTINSYLGKLSIKGFNSEDIEFDTPAIDKGLEGAVQELIKHYPFIAEKVTDKIPVDVDMLEVGQTYKVELDDFYDGCHSVHIAKYIGKKEKYYYFKNRHTWRYEKKDIYLLWKMNNKENEVTNEIQK